MISNVLGPIRKYFDIGKRFVLFSGFIIRTNIDIFGGWTQGVAVASPGVLDRH